MRNLLIVLAAGTILGGCATQAPPPPPAEVAAPAPVAVPEAAPAPKPQYGAFGLDVAGMDKNVAAGDDFFEYANGTWAKNTPIPPDKSRYGMFNVLDDLSKVRTRTIIEEQSKDPNSKIGNAFASYMDEATIESKGLAPFEPWLSEVRGIKSKKDLAKLYSDADHLGIDI
ncbi:MAG TPA: M13 family metallopeptidase N-terminal domain-containing protein, partial [Sphingomicrobium sp.]